MKEWRERSSPVYPEVQPKQQPSQVVWEAAWKGTVGDEPTHPAF